MTRKKVQSAGIWPSEPLFVRDQDLDGREVRFDPTNCERWGPIGHTELWDDEDGCLSEFEFQEQLFRDPSGHWTLLRVEATRSDRNSFQTGTIGVRRLKDSDAVLWLMKANLSIPADVARLCKEHTFAHKRPPNKTAQRIAANSDSELKSLDFVPTSLQVAILHTLVGKAMTKEVLASKVSNGDGSRFYKPGGIKELMSLGKIKNKRGVGYYRPDRPPKWE